MARTRYQQGSLKLRKGKHKTVWVGRWREDEVLENGRTERVVKEKVLGTLEDFPTKKLAMRELESILAPINAVTYRPTRAATFKEFAEKWSTSIVPDFKPSTRSGIRSALRTRLLPFFGTWKLRDISTELMQEFVSSSKGSPKTTRNLVSYLKSLWTSARAWGYVTHDPFNGLRLPKLNREEQPFFTLEEMNKIIAAASEPWKSFYWILSETGIRIGELRALAWEDIDFEESSLSVRHGAYGTTILTPKTRKGNRTFAMSPQLRDHLLLRKGDGLMFATRTGKPISYKNLLVNKLFPLLDQLGIPRKGFHAFRHGNVTIIGRMGTPIKTVQDRVGHVDVETTLRYTHALSADDRAIASKLGEMFNQTPVMGVGNA